MTDKCGRSAAAATCCGAVPGGVLSTFCLSARLRARRAAQEEFDEGGSGEGTSGSDSGGWLCASHGTFYRERIFISSKVLLRFFRNGLLLFSGFGF